MACAPSPRPTYLLSSCSLRRPTRAPAPRCSGPRSPSSPPRAAPAGSFCARAAFFAAGALLYWYLVFTARGGEPYALTLLGAGAFISAALMLAALYPAAVAKALAPDAASGAAPASALLSYFAPMLVAAHMNLFTVFFPDFSFDATLLRLAPGPAAAVGALFCVLVLGVLYFARQFYLSGAWGFVGSVYLASAAAFALVSVLLRLRASVHLHHFMIALCLIPLTRFPTLPARVAQGVLVGIMLNGVAFWGVAGPWDLSSPPLPAAPACSPSVSAVARGAAGANVSVAWAGCAPPPPAAALALSVNGGALAGLGGSGAAALLEGVPLGANLSLALFHTFADGSASALGAAAAYTIV